MNLSLAIRSVPLFRYLSDDHVSLLATLATELRREPGEELFAQGEVKNDLFFIESGRVQISRAGPNLGPQTFALLGAGEHFGTLSLLYEDPHFSTATTVEPTRLWVIEHERFQVELLRSRDLGSALLRGITHELRDANRRIRSLTTQWNRRTSHTLRLPGGAQAVGQSVPPRLSPPPPI